MNYAKKILDATVSMGLKNKDDELYMLEENEIQPMALDSVVISEVVKDNIKENHGNREFDVDALIDSFDI
ncbi:14693_t:CDS:2 [Racocetra fulgida]|uniref:14693_t:CDS:1 n=1 Tax=Racocetra fulgida TaxID=60492 RepID=A0A9N9HBZ3_9GLOM|nr:14693_t:CDS:2 [Racocetra fulgida]